MMYRRRSILLVLALLLAAPTFAQGPTVYAVTNRTSIPMPDPSHGINIVADSRPGMGRIPFGQWVTVDLRDDHPFWEGYRKPNIPETTRAITFSGILIVTNPSGLNCDVQATFRSPGSTLNTGSYHLQSMATTGAGDRDPGTVTVPIVNKQFQMYVWTDPACTQGGSTVAVNLLGQMVHWWQDDGSSTTTTPPPPAGSRWFRVCDVSGCYEGFLPPGGGL